MNTDPANSQDIKFEQLSPLLELIYLMVSDMRKYLKIYAEDTKINDLKEYKEVSAALQNLKGVLDKIYGVKKDKTVANPVKMELGNEAASKPQQPYAVTANEPVKSLHEVEPAVSTPSPMMYQFPQPLMQQVQPDAPHIDPVVQSAGVEMSVPTKSITGVTFPSQEAGPVAEVLTPQLASTPQMTSAQPSSYAAPVASGQANDSQSQKQQLDEIDSILDELRKLQSNNRPSGI